MEGKGVCPLVSDFGVLSCIGGRPSPWFVGDFISIGDAMDIVRDSRGEYIGGGLYGVGAICWIGLSSVLGSLRLVAMDCGTGPVGVLSFIIPGSVTGGVGPASRGRGGASGTNEAKAPAARDFRSNAPKSS